MDVVIDKVDRGVRFPRLGAGVVGLMVLLAITLPCVVTLPWSKALYFTQTQRMYQAPTWSEPMGTDLLGRSLMWRCLLGGAISLGIGLSSALIAVVIGVTWGMIAGYAGGRTDSLMMRIVDVLYGLPYILLVVLINLALRPAMEHVVGLVTSTELAGNTANIVTLLVAIGGLSWLTMARVIRGQVLSLRSQPFVEAARACGVTPGRILLRHLLPNLVGPIVVYATLTVPAAILQESFLSFLGIGVQPPLPSWGNLASSGLNELHQMAMAPGDARWWLIVWPCVLLGLTLLALNFLGDALRREMDPRKGR